jgi:hypothetical protein
MLSHEKRKNCQFDIHTVYEPFDIVGEKEKEKERERERD